MEGMGRNEISRVFGFAQMVYLNKMFLRYRSRPSFLPVATYIYESNQDLWTKKRPQFRCNTAEKTTPRRALFHSNRDVIAAWFIRL